MLASLGKNSLFIFFGGEGAEFSTSFRLSVYQYNTSCMDTQTCSFEEITESTLEEITKDQSGTTLQVHYPKRKLKGATYFEYVSCKAISGN